MTVKTIGLDIAKHGFQVHGADATGRAVVKKRLRREQGKYIGKIMISSPTTANTAIDRLFGIVSGTVLIGNRK